MIRQARLSKPLYLEVKINNPSLQRETIVWSTAVSTAGQGLSNCLTARQSFCYHKAGFQQALLVLGFPVQAFFCLLFLIIFIVIVCYSSFIFIFIVSMFLPLEISKVEGSQVLDTQTAPR